jgi:hypothetical protein
LPAGGRPVLSWQFVSPPKPLQAKLFRYLAWTTVALVFAANFYRAATQSIVFDEAYTYEHFVNVPFARVFAPYSGIANNHLINTLLARLSVGLFGPSELSLRLPSLVGGLFYLLGAKELVALLFGPTILGLLCLLALTINPLVMDFMSAARGYGMGLAFDVWALVLMARLLQVGQSGSDPRPSRNALVGTGMLLALSTVSNLAFLPVNVSFLIVLSALLIIPAILENGRSGGVRLAYDLILRAFIPFTVILVAATYEPHLAHWRSAAYYVGVPTLGDTAQGLVDLSLRHHRTLFPLDTRSPLFDDVVFAVHRVVAPGLVLASAAVWLWAIFRMATGRDHLQLRGRKAILLLLSGTLMISLAILVLLHAVTGMPFPTDRTALQLVTIASLLLCCLLQAIPAGRAAWRVIYGGGVTMLVALLIQFCIQLNVTDYAVWPYDASTKRLVQAIEAQRSARSPVTWLAVSSFLAPSVNFYRVTRHLDWLRVVAPRIGRPLSDLPLRFFDLYLVLPADRKAITRLDPIRLDDDPYTGVLLAARPRRDRARKD